MAANRDESAPQRRRGRGRPFVKGDPRGNMKGRPTLAAEVEYRERIKIGCPPDDLEVIVRTAVREAKRGGKVGAKAREWLSRQLGTDAPVKTEQKVTATTEQRLILADDVETQRLVRELAAKVYGPKARAAVVEALSPPPSSNGTNGAHPHA